MKDLRFVSINIAVSFLRPERERKGKRPKYVLRKETEISSQERDRNMFSGTRLKYVLRKETEISSQERD